MNIMYLTKEVKFHMAHMLANYNGECKNLHGHTYILQVTVFKNLDLKCENSDMIIDFGVLNKIIKEKILDVCDHSFACWKNSTEKLELKFSQLLKENGKKIVEFNFRPTAEMMSKSFFYILQEALKEYNIKIKSVKLWENPYEHGGVYIMNILENLKNFKKTKIPVVEIFNSISGEGISSGSVVTFVRVAGCNLRCNYCDTKYSYDVQSTNQMSFYEILNEISKYSGKDIICTGGEPLEKDTYKRYLPLFLAMNNYNVRIETNGSVELYSEKEFSLFNFNNLSKKIKYTLDVKCLRK